jgi:cellulose synthase/poly-beta-1,6-N-acetylglucosamine synthase-like glycosyltransferase
MTFLAVCFWVAAGCVVYAYAAYPLLLALAGRLLRRRPRPPGELPQSVAVILAVHNEEGRIDGRLRELTGQVAAAGISGEVIVVSDGSTDATAAIARRHQGDGVRVIELPAQQGKAAALSAAGAHTSADVLAFADARQVWAPDALRRLLDAFADPAVGAVSGDLVIASSPGVVGGVGLYWRYEKWIRSQESRVHSVVGVTGAIAAVRRRLFRPIPPGTLLDDVYWPLRVALQGYRVLHDRRARAYDRLPEGVGDEFRRKVRTLSGNFQLLARLPEALLPWRNPVWLQFVSHKCLRLLVPWALLVMLAGSALLPGEVYRVAFWGQAFFYLAGVAAFWSRLARKSRLASAASSFLVLNGAAGLALLVWLTGGAERSWHKAHYQAPAMAPGNPKG